MLAAAVLNADLGTRQLPIHPMSIRCSAVAPSPLEQLGVVDIEVDEAQSDTSEADRSTLKLDLLRIGAACSRGETATDADLAEARRAISMLEDVNPTLEPALASSCVGTWDLVFADTQLFRSSPFFMAGRAVCADGDEAARYDWFCDMHRAALAISNIGKVRQIVSTDTITSEFEVSVGAVPFLSDALPFLRYSGGLPFEITGAIVSSASIDTKSGDAWSLLMDTVEIKGSNIPLLRQVLDRGLNLQTRALGGLLEQAVPEYANPTPAFTTTYLDDEVRVSKDQDGKLFVYARVSDSTEPTDYTSRPSDLGLGQLLQGIAGQAGLV
jgi:hypothetical protein